MANGFKIPRSLSDTYVYYNHLKETYPDIYTKIKDDLENTAFSFGGGDLRFDGCGDQSFARRNQRASPRGGRGNGKRRKDIACRAADRDAAQKRADTSENGGLLRPHGSVFAYLRRKGVL